MGFYIMYAIIRIGWESCVFVGFFEENDEIVPKF